MCHCLPLSLVPGISLSVDSDGTREKTAVVSVVADSGGGARRRVHLVSISSSSGGSGARLRIWWGEVGWEVVEKWEILTE